MKHGFNIRLDYDDDAEFQKRLGMFRFFSLPRILAQEGEFDICIRAQPRHHETLRSLHPLIIPYSYHGTLENGKIEAIRRFKYEDTEGIGKYHSQIAIDSDDLIEPGFLARVEKEFRKLDQVLLLSFVPFYFDLSTGLLYHTRYRKNIVPSMFMALYSPSLRDYPFIYERSHTKMKFHKRKLIEEGYCYRVIHDSNIRGRSRNLKEEDLVCS